MDGNGQPQVESAPVAPVEPAAVPAPVQYQQPPAPAAPQDVRSTFSDNFAAEQAAQAAAQPAPTAQPAAPAPAAPVATVAPAVPESTEPTPDQLRDLVAYYEAQLQRQNQAPAAPADPSTPAPAEWTPEQHFASKWSLPDYDPNWDAMISSGMVEKDESGAFVPVSGKEWLNASPELAALNKYELQHRNTIRGLFEGNFYKKTFQVYQEPIQKMIEQKVEELLTQRTTAQQTSQVVDTFFEQNRSHLYTQVKGQEVPTAWARQLAAECQQLADDGVTDHARQIRRAIEKYPAPQPAAPAPAPAAPPASSLLDTAFNAAAHQPNGSAHVQASQDRQLTRSDFSTFFSDRFKLQNA